MKFKRNQNYFDVLVFSFPQILEVHPPSWRKKSVLKMALRGPRDVNKLSCIWGPVEWEEMTCATVMSYLLSLNPMHLKNTRASVEDTKQKSMK